MINVSTNTATVVTSSVRTVKQLQFCPRCGQSFDSNPEAVALCKDCSLPTEPRIGLTLHGMEAKHIGVKALLKTHIVGESTQLAFESKFAATCEGCGDEHEFDFLGKENQSNLLEAITRITLPSRSVLSTLPRKNGDHQHQWKITKTMMGDYREVRMRDVTELEDIAEKSQVTKDYKGFMLGSVPSEKRVLCDAEIFAHPRTNELTILVRKAFPLRYSLEGFKLKDKEVASLRKLEQFDYDRLLLTADRTVAPEIRGRALAKLVSWLTNTSVNWFKIPGNAETIPGCIRSLDVGDSRTGKGSIVRWWRRMPLTEYAVGETSSRTGLTYYIDTDSNIIVWGLLPTADRGSALIEALHGISPEEIMQFREALAQQRIKVQRKVSGEAWCRARITADANAPQDLDQYVFPIQALPRLRFFHDSVDITRWDLLVPFDKKDVDTEVLLSGMPEENGLDLPVLSNLVLFACSRRIEDIRVSEEAVKAAKQFLIKHLDEYTLSQAPLLHRGSLAPLLRITIAFAIGTFSVLEDNETVIVLRKHFDMTERLVTELLERWGLKDYIDFLGAKAVTEEELVELCAWLDGKEVATRILRELSSRSWGGQELAGRVGADYGTVRNVMTELKTRELVIRLTSGYQLAGKGASLVRYLMKPAAPAVSEQIKTALKILRELITELNGDSPLTVEFERKLATEKTGDPASLVKLLLKDGHIYEPNPGHVRLTRF